MTLDAAELLAELVLALEAHPVLASRLRAALAPSVVQAERVYMKPAEAAARYGISRRTLFAWLGEGLPSCGSGRTRRVPTSEADQWVRERESTDDAIEQRARADAARAAKRVVQ